MHKKKKLKPLLSLSLSVMFTAQGSLLYNPNPPLVVVFPTSIAPTSNLSSSTQRNATHVHHISAAAVLSVGPTPKKERNNQKIEIT